MIWVPSPEPQLSSYGTSPTEHSPEPNRILVEQHSPEPNRVLDGQHTPDSGGKTDEEVHNATSLDSEDLSRDIGPVEVVLPDLNASLDHPPDLSGDSLEETEQAVEGLVPGREPQVECDGEQAASVEVVASTAEEGDDSRGKPPDSQEEPFVLAGDAPHKHEVSEESGEPAPAMDEGREKEGEGFEQTDEKKDGKDESELLPQYEEDEEDEDR